MSKHGKFVVGLTGGFASGKTTVCRLFSRWGARTLDCDRLAHLALKKGSSVYRRILRQFGREVLSPSGAIDRARLARVVFTSASRRLKLERIVHPFVLRKIKQRLRRLRGIVVIEVPLLFESGFDRFCGCTVAVYCKRAQQIARATRAGAFTLREARRRICHQISSRERLRRSDFIIDNSSTRRRAKQDALRVWKRIKKMYNKRG